MGLKVERTWKVVADNDLPPERRATETQLFYTVAYGGKWVEHDVIFTPNGFGRLVLDHNGDYSRTEPINGVTHWMPEIEHPDEA